MRLHGCLRADTTPVSDTTASKIPPGVTNRSCSAGAMEATDVGGSITGSAGGAFSLGGGATAGGAAVEVG